MKQSFMWRVKSPLLTQTQKLQINAHWCVRRGFSSGALASLRAFNKTALLFVPIRYIFQYKVIQSTEKLWSSGEVYLQVNCILVGEFDCRRVLRVHQVVVLGDETHEVRNLPDDDAVGSGQAAGGGQVAAGVAGLQSCSRSCCAGADGAAPPQIGRVDVDQACWARWKDISSILEHAEIFNLQNPSVAIFHSNLSHFEHIYGFMMMLSIMVQSKRDLQYSYPMLQQTNAVFA